MPKDYDFRYALDKNPMPGHLFECNPVDEVTTPRGIDTPVASSGKTLRFQIQLDKWPITPRTTREASRVPFLNTRRCLTILFQLYRNPAIEVRNGEET